MHSTASVGVCLLSLLCATPPVTAQEQVVTVWSWPLSASSPQPLADITYNAETLTSSVAKYSPPESSYSAQDLVRVGLYDPKSSEWRGSVTSAASFNPRHQHKVHLHVDASGSPYSVDFVAFANPIDPREEKRTAKKEAREAAEAGKKKPSKPSPKTKNKGAEVKENPQPMVDVIKQGQGPSPHLNKPVVLNQEGKVDDKEPEKTLLQK